MTSVMPLVTDPILLPLSFTFQEPQTGPTGPNDQSASGQTGAGTTDSGGGGAPGGAAPAGDPCGGPQTFLMMGLFLALMYFMVLRPESKRRKETQSMLSLLKAGDHVVTIGGMHGTVVSLGEKECILRVDQVQMQFDRSAIARVVRDDDTPAKTS